MKFLSSERLSQHKYKTPEGYLICVDAILARTGKQTYRKNEVFADSEDDSEIEVDRKAEEVFSPATLASFENKPITVEHPDEDVNAGNHNELSVGFVRDVHKGVAEGQDVMLGTLVITDAQTIAEIENGEHTDLSCGYDCDIIDEANPQQRNIRGNHVALCQQGRAGIARIVDSTKIIDSKYFMATFETHSDKWGDDEYSIFIRANDIYEAEKKARERANIMNDKFLRIKEGNHSEYLKFRARGLAIDSVKDEYSKLAKDIVVGMTIRHNSNFGHEYGKVKEILKGKDREGEYITFNLDNGSTSYRPNDKVEIKDSVKDAKINDNYQVGQLFKTQGSAVYKIIKIAPNQFGTPSLYMQNIYDKDNWTIIETISNFDDDVKKGRYKKINDSVKDANRNLNDIINHFKTWGYLSRSELQQVVDFYRLTRSDMIVINEALGHEYTNDLHKLKYHDSVKDEDIFKVDVSSAEDRDISRFITEAQNAGFTTEDKGYTIYLKNGNRDMLNKLKARTHTTAIKFVDSVKDSTYSEARRAIEHWVKESKLSEDIIKLLNKNFKQLSAEERQAAYEEATGYKFALKYFDSIKDIAPTKASGTDKIVYIMQSDADSNLYFYIGKTFSMKEGAWGYTKYEMGSTSPEQLKAELTRNGWHEVNNGPAKIIDAQAVIFKGENTFIFANKDMIPERTHYKGDVEYNGKEYYYHEGFESKRKYLIPIVDSVNTKDSKNDSCKDSKPEFWALGKWIWDEVKQDWYDTGRKMYYTEIVRNSSFDSKKKYEISYVEDSIEHIHIVRANSLKEAIAKVKDGFYGGIEESKLRASNDFILKRLFAELDHLKKQPTSVKQENDIYDIKQQLEARVKQIKREFE